MSTRLGFLLTGSVLAQALSYAAALGVVLLATTHGERQRAGDFIIGFFLARIPILLFQAVQAALLPKLAGLAGSGRREDFRAALAKLVLIVSAIGVIGVVAGYTLGPWMGHILFGDKFNLNSGDLALLAAGSGAFILALTLAQALIALLGHARVVVAWVIGLAGFVVVTALGSSLFFRVELGYLIGSSLAAIAMGALLMDQMRRSGPTASICWSSRSSTSRSRSELRGYVVRLLRAASAQHAPRVRRSVRLARGCTTACARSRCTFACGANRLVRRCASG